MLILKSVNEKIAIVSSDFPCKKGVECFFHTILSTTNELLICYFSSFVFLFGLLGEINLLFLAGFEAFDVAGMTDDEKDIDE